MGLIKKISDMRQARQKEKELKKEERVTLREIAQERIAQKSFDEMLDMKIPCEKIVRLENKDGEIHYFQMGGKDIDGIAFNVERGNRINMPSKFRQLTGANSGDIHEINPPSGYRSGLYHCEFNGFSIFAIETKSVHRSYKDNYFQRRYGNTITLRQLLMKWKTDNRQMMDITIENDYDMVKRVYDSEDMFVKGQSQELSK